VLGVKGVIVVAERAGPFRVRIGIQTATTDVEIANAPISPSVGSGLGYVQSVAKLMFNFDPTNASNGDINAHAYWRLGLLYSSATVNTFARGDAILYSGYRV
jgi:hypothetical protein